MPVFTSAIQEPTTAQNRAYASVMGMNQNEAYSGVNNNFETEHEHQSHVYEELLHEILPVHPKPEYAEI